MKRLVDEVVTELEAADGEFDVRVVPQGFDHARAAFAVVNGNSSDELQMGILYCIGSPDAAWAG